MDDVWQSSTFTNHRPRSHDLLETLLELSDPPPKKSHLAAAARPTAPPQSTLQSQVRKLKVCRRTQKKKYCKKISLFSPLRRGKNQASSYLPAADLEISPNHRENPSDPQLRFMLSHRHSDTAWPSALMPLPSPRRNRYMGDGWDNNTLPVPTLGPADVGEKRHAHIQERLVCVSHSMAFRYGKTSSRRFLHRPAFVSYPTENLCRAFTHSNRFPMGK